MSLIHCPACDSTQLSQSECDYPAPSQKGAPQKIIFCPDCGLGVSHPVPSDEALKQLYEQNEYWGNIPLEITEKTYPVPFALAHARWRLLARFLEAPQAPIDLLDIGAGQGCLGLVAHRYSAMRSYSMVEPDRRFQEAVKTVWHQHHLSALLNRFSDVHEVNGKFHIVALSHLLEHLTDPVSFLKTVKSLIHADGLLFIDVPNQDFLFKRDVFPHLFFFSAESLRKLLEQSGYQVLHVSGWGRHWKTSPMNGHRTSVLRVAARLIHPMRWFLPGNYFRSYYAWHFGVDQPHSQGTWLRAIARLSRE